MSHVLQLKLYRRDEVRLVKALRVVKKPPQDVNSTAVAYRQYLGRVQGHKEDVIVTYYDDTIIEFTRDIQHLKELWSESLSLLSGARLTFNIQGTRT